MAPSSRSARIGAGLFVVAVVACAVVAFAVSAAAAPAKTPAWRIVHAGGTADLRALSPVSGRVAWASGSEGTVLRTTDRGRTWRDVGPPGTRELEFRGLKAFDARNAVIMSVGDDPGAFRIYRTSDGGRHWRITNQNRHPDAFYDCIAFFDRKRGLVMSDPVEGRFRILVTADGGRSWRVSPPRNMPPAHPDEYGFAASNTCITTVGERHAWFGSGGPSGGRVFRSSDGGRTWQVAQTPLRRGAAAGVFAVAFRTPLQGLAIGGDFTTPALAPRALSRPTADAPGRWSGAARRRAATAPAPHGSRARTPRWRSASPAATSRPTAASRGGGSTRGASTRSCARRAPRAGRRAPRSGSAGWPSAEVRGARAAQRLSRTAT
jgi:photosystem II stability/assembly factor-like uncharacterized protein